MWTRCRFRHLFSLEFEVRAMKYPMDLTGTRFGRLTVLEKVGVQGQGKRGSQSLWRCLCDCGNEKIVIRNSLVCGNTRSCGCLDQENKKTMHLKHGMAKTRIWKIWIGMRSRCEHEKDKSYPYYGGRGISVCEEWSEFEQFLEWAIQSGYDDTMTIERIDTNGDYCPENCRWATRKEQTRNRRITKKVMYNGKEIPLGEVAEIEGITYQQAYTKYARRK